MKNKSYFLFLLAILGMCALSFLIYFDSRSGRTSGEVSLLSDAPFSLGNLPISEKEQSGDFESQGKDSKVVPLNLELSPSPEKLEFKFPHQVRSAQNHPYFKNLISAPGPLQLYKKGLEIFDNNSSAGQAAAMWITLGLVINDSSKDFAEVFLGSMAEVRKSSREIFNQIKGKKSEIHSDPFFLQMSINLVSQLDLPLAEKNAFLSAEFFSCIFESGCLDSDRYAVAQTGLTFLKAHPETTPMLAKEIQKVIKMETVSWRKKREIFYTLANYYPQIPLEVIQ